MEQMQDICRGSDGPSSFSLNPSKSAFLHALTLSLLPKNHMLFIVSKQSACSIRVHIEGDMNTAKDTIFWQKIPKTIVIRIIVLDDKNSNLFISPSMWTRIEHAHCLETINNMWFLGKRESVTACKKADFDGFVFVYLANTAVLCYSLTIICWCQVQDYIYWIISTENDHRHHHKFIKYEKRLRKEGR
jgi:hypothetical protein